MPKRPVSRSFTGGHGPKPEDPRPIPSQPVHPTEAIALFQRGMEALQRHSYSEAAAAFNAVVMGFPSERALLDRARVYLELCQRETNKRPAVPKTIEERMTAATAAPNKGDDQAA